MDIDELKNKWKLIDEAPCKPAVDEHQLAIKLAASRVIRRKTEL